MNFYLIFHISCRIIRLILFLSYHILSYVFTYAFMYFHILYCRSYTFICSYTVFLVLVTVYYHHIAVLCFSYYIIYFLHFLYIYFSFSFMFMPANTLEADTGNNCVYSEVLSLYETVISICMYPKVLSLYETVISI